MALLRVPCNFVRPLAGLCTELEADEEIELSQEFWKSHGGVGPKAPARAYPKTITIKVPRIESSIATLSFAGCFGQYVEGIRRGTTAGRIVIRYAHGPDQTKKLIVGHHLVDSAEIDAVDAKFGDQCERRTIGKVELDSQVLRLDELIVYIQSQYVPTSVTFTMTHDVPSIVLTNCWANVQAPAGCPFHSKSPGLSLQDLGSVVRIGDPMRFQLAKSQLGDSLLTVGSDLDEARGLALTFIAVVSAAKLEAGGSRKIHRFQLEAARALEKCKTAVEVQARSLTLLQELVPELHTATDIQEPKIAKALQIVDRSYAEDLTDELVAQELGLSVSHFRALFRKNVGQPFHQYLLGFRLDKARTYLIEEEPTVNEVIRWVGFRSASHFSRAFKQRFRMSPSNLREGIPEEYELQNVGDSPE